MGIDPTTHKPKNHALGCSQPKEVANLSHMAQWESARLEAEARIVRESKSNSFTSRPPCLDILKVWQGTWMKRKEAVFASNANLESPTSILNFSENNTITNVVGLINDTTNYAGPCKGILGNSMQLHDTTNYANLPDSLSFLDGFGDLHGPGQGVFEDNKANYWTNILNVVNSPMGSPVF